MALEDPSTDLTAPRGRRDQGAQQGLFGARLALGVTGLGLLVIGLGWFGASGRGAQVDGSTDLRAQIPYLLSGGFLGLALVVLGAALLLSHTTRLERARGDALMEARFDALTAALGGAPAHLLPEGLVVAGATAYHAPDCRLVDGRDGQEVVSVEDAEANGLRPCRLCSRASG